VIWPPSSFEEAYDQLTALLEKDRQRKAADLAHLEYLVARSWESPPSPEADEAPAGTRRRAPRDSDRVTAIVPEEPTPFVVLPRRTTHGGPWGPAMVEKLTRIALEGR